jgi:hypothetical protein
MIPSAPPSWRSRTVHSASAPSMLMWSGPLLALAVVLTACADGTSARSGPSQDEDATSEPGPTSAQPTAVPASEVLEVRAGGVRLVATLRDTGAARDLRTQLPTRLTMRDHGGVEKTGPLKRAIAVTNEPDGADPDVGDLGYYAPGHDLVPYYGDQSYFDGIVILGRLKGDVADLADLEGDIDVQVGLLAHNDD